MKICPNCGKVLSYNSYFGAYICDNCKWEDASFGEKRNMGTIYHKVQYFEIKTGSCFQRGVTVKKR